MKKDFLDRNLALETVRVTEIAALASSLHMGKGNEKSADQSAVNAMRSFLNNMPISGKIVEINDKLEESPELVNESPYESGWMVLISPTEELMGLLDSKSYRDCID